MNTGFYDWFNEIILIPFVDKIRRTRKHSSESVYAWFQLDGEATQIQCYENKNLLDTLLAHNIYPFSLHVILRGCTTKLSADEEFNICSKFNGLVAKARRQGELFDTDFNAAGIGMNDPTEKDSLVLNRRRMVVLTNPAFIAREDAKKQVKEQARLDIEAAKADKKRKREEKAAQPKKVRKPKATTQATTQVVVPEESLVIKFTKESLNTSSSSIVL